MTIGLIVSCVLIHVISQIAFTPTTDERAALTQAFDAMMTYWEAHPTLEPTRKDEWLLDALPEEHARRLADFEPEPLPEGAEPDFEAQETLEQLAAGVVHAVPDEPRDRWGFSTANPSPVTALTHMFLHSDWGHLLGNMLFLWVCGALLEDLWGRDILLGLYACAGLAAVLPALCFRDDYVNLIGASGAISGVMGAFAVRLWNLRMRILVLIGVLARPVWVSSWVILLLWLVQDIAGIAEELTGLTDTAHLAHVAGFAFGASVAFVFRRTGLEERHLAAAVASKSVRLVHRNESVEKAFEAFDHNLHPVGRKRLAMTVQRDPENADAAVALWDQALQEGSRSTALEVMVGAIEAELRADDVHSATDHWRELTVQFPSARLEPKGLVRIAECLARRGLRSEAGEALAHAVDASDARTPTTFLLRIADSAREWEPKVSAAAAAAVLARPGISPHERAEATRLTTEAEARLVRVASEA